MFEFENPKESDFLEDLDIDKRALLKCIIIYNCNMHYESLFKCVETLGLVEHEISVRKCRYEGCLESKEC
jgi:hypothetical protein